MGVKRNPKKPGWYILDIRNGAKGKRERIHLQGTEQEAQAEYERLTEHKAGIFGAAGKISSLYSKFITWYGLEHAADTVSDCRNAWKHLKPFFGHHGFRSIEDRVDEYKAYRLSCTYLPGKPDQKPQDDTKEEKPRRKPISKRTITRELAYLSSFCKWAKEKGYTNQTIHIKGFPKKQCKAPIQQTHQFDELQRIIDQTLNSKHNPADLYGLTILMYDVGLRKKEARLIAAERVDLLPKPLVVPGQATYYGSITVTRKGGRELQLPIMTERVYVELKARKEKTKRGPLYINPRTNAPYVDVRDGLKNASSRAKVDKRITHHLLRHDYVTHLHENGADLKTIQSLVGHATIQTTMDIYTHLEHKTLLERAGGFAERVARSSTPKTVGLGNDEKKK